ncbi:ubiquitinyl hydrolase 1 [Steccherinum ochraceum]|uniref:ubiquitinyl hydrolase 1 n=1 Tax=Steccherinum ochraceum TaxID=92696 RepID=A0A4R0RKZ7_9APHY|nr:ubiquitinyl hydrolase 1 [Steccherinum ochraceum]
MPQPVYEKCWIPIEANPEVSILCPSIPVLTYAVQKWSEKAGLVLSQHQFYDVLGFDEELLDLVPKPVKAVILLFPVLDQVDLKRDEEDARIAKDGQHPIDNTVVWIQQTIDNACGAMAILHALTNVTNVTLTPGSALADFIDDCKDKSGIQRAKILEQSEVFAKLHGEVAKEGQSEVPKLHEEVTGHYTCFVQAPSPPAREEGIEAPPGGMRLVELDGVLNHWSEQAGLKDAHFTDVYGLDQELLVMIPKPVHAVVLLFPITESSETRRRNDETRIFAEGQDPTIDSKVFWMKQTISNACGTMALLHAILNSGVQLGEDTRLGKFYKECKDKTPEERVKLLETTTLFSDMHEEAASSGQTAVPTDLATDLHFTCFVQANLGEGEPHLIELDGRRTGPVDRGASEDLLATAAAWIKSNYVESTTSIQFSMMALVGGPAKE